MSRHAGHVCACFGCKLQAGSTAAPISQKTCAGRSQYRETPAQDRQRVGPTGPVSCWRSPYLNPQARPAARRPPAHGPLLAAGLRQEARPVCSKPQHRACGRMSGGGIVRRAWLARGAAQSARSSHAHSPFSTSMYFALVRQEANEASRSPGREAAGQHRVLLAQPRTCPGAHVCWMPDGDAQDQQPTLRQRFVAAPYIGASFGDACGWWAFAVALDSRFARV